MTVPLIAAVTGAILILMQGLLMVLVGLHRGQSGVALGTGDNPALERKIRRHGNLAENAGLFVAVLALAEMTVVPDHIIRIIALIFIIARIFHAIALSSVAGSHGAKTGKIFVAARLLGALGTFGSFFALGGYLLFGIF